VVRETAKTNSGYLMELSIIAMKNKNIIELTTRHKLIRPALLAILLLVDDSFNIEKTLISDFFVSLFFA
jgi:hypothetical protein